MSITILSHIDRLTVTYTLTIRNEAHTGTICKGTPITFTDTIPQGLSNVRAKGDHWDIKVRPNVRPPVVTGTYKGCYPVTSGATLSAVTITGTITRNASNVLTNSASVNISGNTDKVHSKQVVHDNIGRILSSLPPLNKNNSNGSCHSSCGDQGSNTCDNECDQQSAHTSVKEKVYISVQQSVDTSCGCSQQSTSDSSGSKPTDDSKPTDTPTPSQGKDSPSGKGSAFPALPNTGSDPEGNPLP